MKNGKPIKIAILLTILFPAWSILWFPSPVQAADDYCIWQTASQQKNPCDAPGTNTNYWVIDSTKTSCTGKPDPGENICCCQIKIIPGQCSSDVNCSNGQTCLNNWCQDPIVVKTPKYTPPDLQIKIPGLSLVASDVSCTVQSDGGYACQVPWIGKYIKAFYNYGLGIAGILAALVLMAGGVLWLVSRGDASKVTQAKELIVGSITGLIILVGSYALLIQINPDLVNFKPITVGYIKEELIPNGSDSVNNLTSAACPTDNNLVGISSLVSLNNVSDPRLVSSAADSLKAAVAEASKQNVKLMVTSANRTYEKQKELWDKVLKNNNGDEAVTRTLVAPPSQCQGTCYGHCAGVAIDVCISGSASCGKMGKKSYAYYSDADVVKLQDIMKKAGWKRYCGEWWHFQAPGNDPGWPCSP